MEWGGCRVWNADHQIGEQGCQQHDPTGAVPKTDAPIAQAITGIRVTKQYSAKVQQNGGRQRNAYPLQPEPGDSLIKGFQRTHNDVHDIDYDHTAQQGGKCACHATAAVILQNIQ